MFDGLKMSFAYPFTNRTPTPIFDHLTPTYRLPVDVEPGERLALAQRGAEAAAEAVPALAHLLCCQAARGGTCVIWTGI